MLTAAAGLVLVAASLIQPWVPPSLLYRDLFATQYVDRHIGLYSNLGSFLWCSTAAVTLSAAFVLYVLHGASRDAWLLGYFGVLSGILLADDFFMVHEASRSLFGLPPDAFVGLLMIAMLGGLVIFFGGLLRLGWPLLAGALAMFAAGLVGDLLNDRHPEPKPELLYVAEDAPKLVGIAFWATFFVRASLLCMIGACQGHEPGRAGKSRR